MRRAAFSTSAFSRAFGGTSCCCSAAASHWAYLVTNTLNALTGNQQLASTIGTGVWLLPSLLLFLYLPLCLGDTESIVDRPKANSIFQQRRAVTNVMALHIEAFGSSDRTGDQCLLQPRDALVKNSQKRGIFI